MLVAINGTGPCPVGKTNGESGTWSKETDTIRLNSEGGNSRSGMEDILQCGETGREAN